MRKIFKLAVSCLLLLGALLLLTDPQKLPAVFLVLPFVLIFGTLVFIFAFILVLQGTVPFRAVRLAAFGAALPAALLTLHSLGQLTLRDVVTLGLLFGVGYLYVTRIARYNVRS